MPCCDLNRSRKKEEGLGQTGQQKWAKELSQNLEGVVEAEAAEHHQLRVEVVAAEVVVVVEEAEEEAEAEEAEVVVAEAEEAEKKLEIWLNPRDLSLRVDIWASQELECH